MLIYKLFFLDLPAFVKKPQDTTVVLGKPLKIELEISGIPLPEITWFKDNEVLQENERVKIEAKHKGTFFLSFQTCENIDCGTYTVKLHNESGDAEASFKIIVNGMKKKRINFCQYSIFFVVEMPSILKPLEPTVECLEKEQCSLECIIIGTPTPTISW